MLPGAVHASGAIDCRAIAAESVGQIPGDTAYRGHADTGDIVNLAVRKTLLEQFDHLPAIDERLEFSWGAQVTKVGTALRDRPQAGYGAK